ncbi:insulinase family protein [Entomospira entomophila]|uniref:Peptidase M16C associated domain-containing protein n=1 Tax=Entomospira entomophila TaxID=2719988 RepID=A0A968G928_9SPIO|nr:insulinase family protein [Entomospira entomophilus]NIZ40177.1 hypothetical protein [Entomospira entomophilus]WDI35736.1 insulinase family protein [Entomospira entomophilus]
MKESTHYTILSEQSVPEYRSHGYHLRHEQSGAEIFILQNDDEENFFSFGFRTPSEDDRGLAHILEHSVLAGSKHYPIKDPFLTLLRSSMQTFLNAMTYPDKTLYPAASPVKQDFFNLFDVYGDAVFFPLIQEETFWQEGYRLIYNKEDDSLEHGGVVYNEMKGAYSSIESYAFDAVVQSLHPTNCYQYDSGGNPDMIPSITHEMLVNFHQKYYHPNNSKIFFYGNIPLEEKLTLLHDRFLQHFHNDTPLQSHIQEETPFTERHYEVREFPSHGTEDTSYISLNWLTAPLTETKTMLALEVLNHILLGSSGAPLYVALQTSGLGQDLSPVCGFSFDFNRAIFSAGLRGIQAEDQKKFEDLVDHALQSIIDTSISHDMIESALRSVEMQRRELRSGSFGLRLMSRLYKGWNYDLNPFDAIFFEEPMAKLREEAFAPHYFETLIKQYLIENKHSSLTLITPNPALVTIKESEIQQDLTNRLLAMSSQEKDALMTQELRLTEHQNKEDDPTVMPRLTRDHIPLKVKDIPASTTTILADRPLYQVEVFSNGVYHWNVAFELHDFSQDDLLWLPLFCRAMSGMGSDQYSYIEMAQKINRDSGGLNFILDTGNYHDINGSSIDRSAMLHINFKALESQLESMPQTLQEAIFSINFQDADRLQALYWELYNEMSAAVVPSGSGVIGLRMSRLFNESAYTEELWHGIDQLLFLESLQPQWNEASFYNSVIARFQNFTTRIFQQNRAHFGFVAPDKNQATNALLTIFNPLNHQMKNSPIQSTPLPLDVCQQEFIATNTEVNFVGIALPAHPFTHPKRSAEKILARFLTIGELWHAVRMQGGAYGVSASVSGSVHGIFTITSYRDPHITRTQQVFHDVLTSFESISQQDLDDTLIALVGKENRPHGPQEALTLAMKRSIYLVTSELRQKSRDTLLEVTPEDIISVAKELSQKLQQAFIVVLTNQKQAQEHQKEGITITNLSK